MRQKTGDKHGAILKAAVQVFADQGFAEAKVARIARVAGVATGSVYNYFDSKEDLLHSIFRDMWTRILEDLAELAGQTEVPSDQRLERMVDTVFDRFSDDANLARVFVNEQSFWMHRWEGELEQLYGRFMELLGRTLQDAGLRSQMDPTIQRYLVFGAVRQLIHQWVDPKCAFTREQAHAQILLLLHSLTGQD
ncbi:MAG: TetR/AcrR family transcriptional regulator [bacterium]|jgi:TetR/AcrR family fatty acid metabolism transcriptional regulator|nr:TetR/AcrR family transcriptional regulator [bacterium]